MDRSPLLETWLDLALQLDPDRSVPELRATLLDVLENNNLSENAPAWFVDFWRAVADRRTTGPVHVMPDGLGDTANAMAELSLVLPIGWDDYGEGVALDLAPLHLRAFIGREGPGGGYTYDVQRT